MGIEEAYRPADSSSRSNELTLSFHYSPHPRSTILTIMLTLAEGSRPTSNTDAEALAMSEEEDRLIEDALYFSEPDIVHGSPEEQVTSPTRSNSSVVSAHSPPYNVAPVFLLITVSSALIHSRRAAVPRRQ